MILKKNLKPQKDLFLKLTLMYFYFLYVQSACPKTITITREYIMKSKTTFNKTAKICGEITVDILNQLGFFFCIEGSVDHPQDIHPKNTLLTTSITHPISVIQELRSFAAIFEKIANGNKISPKDFRKFKTTRIEAMQLFFEQYQQRLIEIVKKPSVRFNSQPNAYITTGKFYNQRNKENESPNTTTVFSR